MKKLVLAGLVGLTGLMSFGGNASVGMNDYQVPKSVGVAADGTLEVIFPHSFNEGCTNGLGVKMFVRVGNSQGVTEQSFQMIKSIVLSAFMAQKPIKFWYDRVNATCEGGKVVVQR